MTNLWIKWTSTLWGGVAWNIFLAVVPVILALLIRRLARRSDTSLTRNLLIYLLGIVWLVFLPNTCYLLTEWRHFLMRLDSANMYIASRANTAVTIKLMMHTVFFFWYSAMGMLTFALAIRPVAGVLRERGARLWVYGSALFLLASLGVYLGLIHRFNSWDLISRPESILGTVRGLADRPLLSTFIIAFGGALWLAYLAVDIWIDGLIVRCRAVWGKSTKSHNQHV